ncbi:MAG: hypothetical protein K1X66_01805 [Verrucomicrobiae bacterium]|nr:hypothetical protein [Verrucomicrobiae bacterium]
MKKQIILFCGFIFSMRNFHAADMTINGNLDGKGTAIINRRERRVWQTFLQSLRSSVAGGEKTKKEKV